MSITINHQTNDISSTSGTLTVGGVETQPVLISGVNIKTINGSSLLGGGNLEISGGSGGAASGLEQTFLLMGA